MKDRIAQFLYFSGIITIILVIVSFIFAISMLLNIDKHSSFIKMKLEKDNLLGKDIQIVINIIGVPDKIIFRRPLGYSIKEKSMDVRLSPYGSMIYSTNISCLKKVAVNIFGGCRISFNSDDKVMSFKKFLY